MRISFLIDNPSLYEGLRFPDGVTSSIEPLDLAFDAAGYLVAIAVVLFGARMLRRLHDWRRGGVDWGLLERTNWCAGGTMQEVAWKAGLWDVGWDELGGDHSKVGMCSFDPGAGARLEIPYGDITEERALAKDGFYVQSIEEAHYGEMCGVTQDGLRLVLANVVSNGVGMSDGARAVQRWMDMADDERYATDLLALLLRPWSMPLQSQLMQTNAMLEALVRRGHESEYTKREFKRLTAPLMAAVNKCDDEDFKNRARGILGMLMRPSYKMLLDYAHKEAGLWGDDLICDWDRFKREQCDLRNKGAHGLPGERSVELSVLHYYAQILLAYPRPRAHRAPPALYVGRAGRKGLLSAALSGQTYRGTGCGFFSVNEPDNNDLEDSYYVDSQTCPTAQYCGVRLARLCLGCPMMRTTAPAKSTSGSGSTASW